MAGYKTSDYAIDTPKWAELLETMEKQRKGRIALGLTNYTNLNKPAIEAGSYLECVGALYGFSSEEAIPGAGTDTSVNYIMFDPTPMTVAWTVTPPIWSGDKQGWYDAGEAKRYIGGCYRDGVNYIDKWIYGESRDIKSKILGLGLLGATGFKIDNDTRNAAGAQVITGVGFRPSLVIFLARENTYVNTHEVSYGFDDGATHGCVATVDTTEVDYLSITHSIFIRRGVSEYIKGYISAKSDDGFTITWTQDGSWTCDFIYLAFM